MVTRYNHELYDEYRHCSGMVEDKNGEYVTYEDYKELEKTLEDREENDGN